MRIIECIECLWYLAPVTVGEQSDGQDTGCVGMAGGSGNDGWMSDENVAKKDEVIGRMALRRFG
jgi:hypothetical protein